MPTITRNISLLAITFIALVAASLPANADQQPYSKMAPIERYLMANRNAEIALARSAAPPTISNHATVLVLERSGYVTALKGKNGFVCMVGRAWTDTIDLPGVYDPKMLAPYCLNPAAAKSLLPVVDKLTALVLAGDSQTQIVAALKAAYAAKQLPALEPDSMSYMMSKSACLDEQGDDTSHVMFYNTMPDGRDWGAGLDGSPILSSSYWFPNDDQRAMASGLPPIRVFVVGVKRWSDGTPQLVK